jgi:hypothetical protein
MVCSCNNIYNYSVGSKALVCIVRVFKLKEAVSSANLFRLEVREQLLNWGQLGRQHLHKVRRAREHAKKVHGGSARVLLLCTAQLRAKYDCIRK